MDKYINAFKNLTNNFSYYQFIDLLKEFDNEIVIGKNATLTPEVIYYFRQIIFMINDNYIIGHKPGTLGHKLVEDALITKQKLTPSLALCYLLEQMEKLDLTSACDSFVITHQKSRGWRMKVVDYHDHGNRDININWSRYSDPNKNVDEHNYRIMFDILHEVTHVYQSTRAEQTNNPFDMLAYYDYKQASILIDNGGVTTNIYFHQALLSEFMADEQAYVYLAHISRKHPEYFNPDLIQKIQLEYQKRKNGTYGTYGTNPRAAFSALLSDIRKTYEENKMEPSIAFIKPMLEEIEQLNKNAQPIIKELQAMGISEKSCDHYYNIYLESLYHFDGKNIIFNNAELNQSSQTL